MAQEDRILWDIVEEHLDEAEFLAEQWTEARRSASYTLDELERGPESRLAAHVDGLVANGPLALERVAWPVLEDPGSEAPRAAAAALAVLEAGDFRVLGVLGLPEREAPPEIDEDQDDDPEAARIAALLGLAERLDALEPDEAERSAVMEHALGPEAWRIAALPKVGERIAAETDEARGLELRELEVLLAAHAPEGSVALEAEPEEPLPPEWSELDPEARERMRQAELQSIDEQRAATSDEDERTRLTELRALLTADPSDEDEASPTADPPEPVPIEPAPPVEPRVEGLSLALALASHPKLGEQLRALLPRADGPTLALLLHACADRGLHPGPTLQRGLAHDDPQVRCAATRAAAFGDRHELLAAVELQLRHPSPAVRAAALDTCMRWGSRAAWELALTSYKAPEAASARLWIACLGDDRHVEALIPLLADPQLRPDVLWSLGFSGRVPAVVAALALLDDADETTRRLAGEAVAAILGLDLEDDTLWEELPTAAPTEVEGDAPEDDDDDLEAELAPTPEDELPLPNATAIREHWARVRSAFVPGCRYLLGKAVEREGPGWALPRLSCRRVDVVAREVVARSQGVGRWPQRVTAQRHAQAASALGELGRQAGAILGDRR